MRRLQDEVVAPAFTPPMLSALVKGSRWRTFFGSHKPAHGVSWLPSHTRQTLAATSRARSHRI